MKLDPSNLDRRIIYGIIFLVLSIPILTDYTLRPAKMETSQKIYDLIEGLQVSKDKIAFLAMDFGPNTKAENEAQAEVIFEHLLRRRIPVAIFTLYVQGKDFLERIPSRVVARLEKENPSERWKYGVDWVNLGYKIGQAQFIQNLPKSEDLKQTLAKDAYGTNLSDLELLKEIKTFEDISFLGEFTGLVGIFPIYVQFFQKKNYIPPIIHGCTSITIPDAYNYLDSGQIKGLLEGLSGAAYYSELLSKYNKSRQPDTAALMNTALGIGQLTVILLVLLGNIFAWRKARLLKGAN